MTTKRVHLSWTGERNNLRARFGSGYELEMHGPADENGVTPMDHLLAAAAGCSAMDVIHILRKKRQNFTDVSVEAEGVQAGEDPHVYTHGKFTYVVRGTDIKPAAVEQAIALSQNSYCSASIMLKRAGMTLETDYRIEEAE
ncbi:MAG: OsmC family protein [Caldilineaceae bacterium]|nr:OsmC family protein [Caldilineaceae bacterium]